MADQPGAPPEDQLPVFGIDAGATYLSVSFKKRQSDSVTNEDWLQPPGINDPNASNFPAVVAYMESKTEYFNAAVDLMKSNPEQCITHAKVFLGKNIDDESIQPYLERPWPYIIRGRFDEGRSGPVVFDIPFDGGRKEISPFDVIRDMMKQAHKLASDKLGWKDYDATLKYPCILSHPVRFEEVQKQQLREAAEAANWNVMGQIPETTSVLLSHEFEKMTDEHLIVVVDYGGATWDGAVVQSKPGYIKIIRADGDMYTGGSAIDDTIIDKYFRKQLKSRFGLRLVEQPLLLAQLRRKVEQLKMQLSSSTKGVLTLDIPDKGEQVFHLSRVQFDELCGDHFQHSAKCTEQLVKDSGVRLDEITDVCITGGTGRILKVQDGIKALFPESTHFHVKTDLISQVARGNTIQAAIRAGLMDTPTVGQKTVAHSIGITYDSANDREPLSVIIEQNTKHPFKKEQQFRNPHPGHPIIIKVYEGAADTVPVTEPLTTLQLEPDKEAPNENITFTIQMISNKNGNQIKIRATSDYDSTSDDKLIDPTRIMHKNDVIVLPSTADSAQPRASLDDVERLITKLRRDLERQDIITRDKAWFWDKTVTKVSELVQNVRQALSPLRLAFEFDRLKEIEAEMGHSEASSHQDEREDESN